MIELVQKVRDKLYPGEGDLNNRVKAFQIAKHVAFQLQKNDKSKTWGVFRAAQGSENNAEGFTCDIVGISDGSHWDILLDGEGSAKPSWQPHAARQDMKERFIWIGNVHGLTDLFSDESSQEEPPKEEPSTVPATELTKILMMIAGNQQKSIETMQTMIETDRQMISMLHAGIQELKLEIKAGVKIKF